MGDMSADTITIEPGTILKNGARVLAVGGFRPKSEGMIATCIVLAESMNDFVTWEVSVGERDAFWGHYFPRYGGRDAEALAGATADFTKRANR